MARHRRNKARVKHPTYAGMTFDAVYDHGRSQAVGPGPIARTSIHDTVKHKGRIIGKKMTPVAKTYIDTAIELGISSGLYTASGPDHLRLTPKGRDCARQGRRLVRGGNYSCDASKFRAYGIVAGKMVKPHTESFTKEELARLFNSSTKAKSEIETRRQRDLQLQRWASVSTVSGNEDEDIEEADEASTPRAMSPIPLPVPNCSPLRSRLPSDPEAAYPSPQSAPRPAHGARPRPAPETPIAGPSRLRVEDYSLLHERSVTEDKDADMLEGLAIPAPVSAVCGLTVGDVEAPPAPPSPLTPSLLAIQRHTRASRNQILQTLLAQLDRQTSLQTQLVYLGSKVHSMGEEAVTAQNRIIHFEALIVSLKAKIRRIGILALSDMDESAL